MSSSHHRSVAILGFNVDEHVQRVGQALARRGVDAVGVDLSTFPGRATISVSPDAILVNNVDLLTCGAVLLRQVGYMWPMPTRAPTAEEWGASYDDFSEWMACERESTSLKYGLISILAELRAVVNPVSAFTYHQMKPLMFATLAEAGVPVPTWVAGNEGSALRALAEGDGDTPGAVVKPLASGAEVVAAPTEIDPARLQRAPLLYQRFVQGRSVRVYVVGDRVVAAGEVLHGDNIDWRTDAQGVRPLDLDDEVAQLAVTAAKSVEMRFAALDLELTDEGPQFLDVNPTPMFTNFERMTGLNIADPLADDLASLAAAER